jgi:Aminotransferase class IV.
LPTPKDVFDEIGVNEKGEITEGTFTNHRHQTERDLFTLRQSSAVLLNGITRQKVATVEGKIQEKILVSTRP